MRRIIATVWSVLCTFCVFAQLENSNFVLPDSTGINFSSGMPEPFISGMFGYESAASISDSLGNLLFYTNGEIVWNKNHESMPNGTGLDIGLNSGIGSSITQGVIIIPMPEIKNYYYIFYIQKQYDPDVEGLKYSIVNMSLDGGLGDVTEKNIVLFDKPLTEKMQAVKHGNGKDWWLLVHAKPDYEVSEDSTFAFVRFLITSDGILGPYFQTYGPVDSYLVPYDGWGEMIISEQGDKLAYTRYNRLDIYDFDRCTGLLSNWNEVSGFPEISLYGCSFSKTGNKIYVSQISSKGTLFQVSINISDTVNYTFNEIFKVPINNYSIGQHQLYDDRIYFTIVYSVISSNITSIFNQSISLITNADSSFESIIIDTNAIYLEDSRVIAALPNLPNYSLGAHEGSECDTLSTAISDNPKPALSFSIYPNPASSVLHIEPVAQGNNTVIISQVNGSICYTGSFTGTLQIPVAHFAAGVYSISIMNTETGVWYTEKWVKML